VPPEVDKAVGTVAANGIRIEYQEFGDARNPAILLIMGFAAQMVVWPESFCQALADRSFHVIRFDNRDVGLSNHLDGVRAPGMKRSMFASLLNIKLRTPYALEDMALDVVGLLDALDIREAHIVGASMGGMIAQIIAAKHAQRVKSLTSVMSTSGNRKLPGPRPNVLRHVLFRHRKNMDRDRMIGYLVDLWKLTASPLHPTPIDEKQRRVRSWIERDCDPKGNIRQFAAMAANGDRTELLRTIERPTLIIHGEADPLIPVDGGRHTAQCIRDSQLQVIPGMGHDLPEQLVPQLARLIAAHCVNAESSIQNEQASVA